MSSGPLTTVNVTIGFNTQFKFGPFPYLVGGVPQSLAGYAARIYVYDSSGATVIAAAMLVNATTVEHTLTALEVPQLPFQWLSYAVFLDPDGVPDSSSFELVAGTINQTVDIVFLETNVPIARGPAGPPGSGGGGGGGGYATIQNATTPLPQETTLNISGAVLADNAGASRTDMEITADSILPAFTPTLAATTGPTGLIEIGTTYTPTFTPSPTTASSGTVTSATIQDNLGNSRSVTGTSPPLAAAIAGGVYNTTNTPSLATPGTSIKTSVTETVAGVTKTTSAIGPTVAPYVYVGHGASTTPTGIVLSGSTATVTGPGASLAGVLANTYVNQQSLLGSITASNDFLLLAWHSFLGATHQFNDAKTGLQLDMQAPVLFSTTTDTGVTCNYYVARSTNNLGTTTVQPYFYN